MPQFAYTVSDPGSGQKVSGVLVAADRESAARMLAQKNLIVTRISPVVMLRDNVLGWFGLNSVRMKGEQLLAFTEQTAAMMAAGMTIKAAVDVLLTDTADPACRLLLLEMSASLSQGSSLTEVIAQYPSVFNQQYVAMVATGESSGRLPDIMKRLARLIENSLSLKKKVQTAMYYPAFVLGFAFLLITGFFVFGIPRFEEIYHGLGGELPVPTRIFIFIGHTITAFWWLILITMAVGARLAVLAVRTPKGRYHWDKFKLRAPIFGPIFQRIAIARFARTLSTLHSSGVSTAHALELVSASVGNVVIEKVIMEARRHALNGEPLAEPLRQSGWFTEMSVSMTAAGEHSGTLDSMLESIADYYDNQVDIALKGLASLLEPIIMVFLGSAIGVLVITMILPVFELSRSLFS